MKRYVRFCIAGKIYIAITLLLGGVAIFTGNNLLYFTTAVLLGILLSSGIIGRRNIQNIEVSVQLPEEIYAGIPCPFSVTIANRNPKRPLFLIEVTVQKQRLLFPCLQPGKEASQTFFASFDQRGILLLDDIITTGATLNEIAQLLKKSGAKQVDNVLIARTPKAANK